MLGDRAKREADRRLLFAVLVTKTGALAPDVVAKVAENGQRATLGGWAAFFWSAVLGGWAIALVAWPSETLPAAS